MYTGPLPEKMEALLFSSSNLDGQGDEYNCDTLQLAHPLAVHFLFNISLFKGLTSLIE